MAEGHETHERIQGYEALFEPEIDRKYMCPVCLGAMREAMQTSCGHRFCRGCVLGVVNGRPFAKCPVDNMWFRIEDELFPDIAVRREILSLTVICNNHTEGCEWHGELRDLQVHHEGCDFVKVTCPNSGCHESLAQGSLSLHLNNCEQRLVLCQHCEQEVVYADLMKHEVLVCNKFPVRCTLCGKFGIRRQDIQQHIDDEVGDCPHAVVNCSFKNHGCQFRDKRQCMIEHYKDSAHLHLNMLLEKLDCQEKHIDTLNKQMVVKNRTIDDLSLTILKQSEELQAEQSTCYNGRLHWKILTRDTTSMTVRSRSFYTGCPGYKVCIRLELNGHSEGGQDFASLFVILENGKFDEELRFPFNAICHVTVYDQSDGVASNYQADVQCTNVPRCYLEGERSNSQRGRLRFMPTQTLLGERFCKDGVIYMEFVVDHCPGRALSCL